MKLEHGKDYEKGWPSPPIDGEDVLRAYHALMTEGKIQRWCSDRGLRRDEVVVLHSSRTDTYWVQMRITKPKGRLP